jgi:DUF4097 and DUF4098 domain-containing protein YvlB
MLNPTLKSARWLLAAAIGLCGSAAADPIQESFSVSNGGKLTVDADSARLEVRGSDTDQLLITISRRNDDAGDIEDDYIVEFSQKDNSVRLDVKRRNKFTSWFSSGRALVINVSLPDEFDVDLKTSGGGIDIQNLAGVITTQTSGGSLRFEDVDGPIHGRTSGGSIHLDGTSSTADLKTSGGGIRIGQVDGEVFARTSGGSIYIERAGGTVSAHTSGGKIEVAEVHGSVDAKTSGGSIHVAIAGPLTADSTLTTSGGSVTVLVEPTIAMAVDAKSSGGRVNTDLPITIQGSASRTRLEGDLNGGGPLLRLRSSGGSVNLRTL